MKHKKAVVIFFALVMILSIRITANANIDEYGNNWFESCGAYELSEYLEDETKDYLKKIGCDDIGIENLSDISFSAIVGLIKDMISGGIKEPMKCLMKTIGAVILVSICSGFFPDDEKSRTILNLICGSFVIIEIFSHAMQSIRAAVSAMGICAGFEKALIPVLAALVTISGKPASALSVHGLGFAAAQFVESFAAETVMPLIGICGALSVTGAVFPTLRLTAVSDTIRKLLTTLLGSAAALFSGFLALKNVLASTVDGIALKGVKLAANTFIPVIGGAIGDVFTSVAGSLSLVKNAVGIYAIIAFFIITLPVVINLALWVVALRVSCIVSDMLDCKGCSDIIKSIAFIFSMTNTILIFCAAVFIISAGMTVFIGSGE